MRVCQFRHFGVARLPNGAAKAYTGMYFTGANGGMQTPSQVVGLRSWAVGRPSTVDDRRSTVDGSVE